MSLKVIGLDIAKHVFQLDGADTRGKVVDELLKASKSPDLNLKDFPNCLKTLHA